MERGKICEAMVFAVDNAESASEVQYLPCNTSDFLLNYDELEDPLHPMTKAN